LPKAACPILLSGRLSESRPRGMLLSKKASGYRK
jgi:hypothetical protein